MNKTTSRLAAIALGMALAAGLFLGARTAQRKKVILLSQLSDGWPLRMSEAPSSCPRFSDGLHVNSEVTGERIEPIAWEEAGAHGRSALAEYSSHWAEKRLVMFSAEDWTKGIHVQASHLTDYGDFAGFVVGHDSSLHQHDDVLCFDLQVRRGDGSGDLERWQGEARLR